MLMPICPVLFKAFQQQACCLLLSVCNAIWARSLHPLNTVENGYYQRFQVLCSYFLLYTLILQGVIGSFVHFNFGSYTSLPTIAMPSLPNFHFCAAHFGQTKQQIKTMCENKTLCQSTLATLYLCITLRPGTVPNAANEFQGRVSPPPQGLPRLEGQEQEEGRRTHQRCLRDGINGVSRMIELRR